MYELSGLLQYNRGLTEDQIPQMELRNATVSKKDKATGKYKEVDLLTVFEDGPFRMTGKLLRKSVAKSISKWSLASA